MLFLAASVVTQPAVPPPAVEQFKHTLGIRVEAVTILGGHEGLLEPRPFRPLDYHALSGLLLRGVTANCGRLVLYGTGPPVS